MNNSFFKLFSYYSKYAERYFSTLPASNKHFIVDNFHETLISALVAEVAALYNSPDSDSGLCAPQLEGLIAMLDDAHREYNADNNVNYLLHSFAHRNWHSNDLSDENPEEYKIYLRCCPLGDEDEE